MTSQISNDDILRCYESNPTATPTGVTISDAIAKLQRALAKHGDMNICEIFIGKRCDYSEEELELWISDGNNLIDFEDQLLDENKGGTNA